jgi:F-type H+-transporting ATPase subunit gamma
VSVRGSVVDVRFESHLAPINSLLRAGKDGRSVMGVWAQLDSQRVCGIALTATQGLARGMPVESTGGSLKAPVGKAIRARMFDVFGHSIDRGPELSVPGSVAAITALVGRIQIEIESEIRRSRGEYVQLYVFRNHFESTALYEPVSRRLLPLDAQRRDRLTGQRWPNSCLPETLGGPAVTLAALVREYLFISLYKACAESLASENGSRFAAMQRAEKNIDALSAEFSRSFYRLRQSSIDEELFDAIPGFKAISAKTRLPRYEPND